MTRVQAYLERERQRLGLKKWNVVEFGEMQSVKENESWTLLGLTAPAAPEVVVD